MELTLTSTIALGILIAGGALSVVFFFAMALKSFCCFCSQDTAPKSSPDHLFGEPTR
jgi:hypothetical protein